MFGNFFVSLLCSLLSFCFCFVKFWGKKKKTLVYQILKYKIWCLRYQMLLFLGTTKRTDVLKYAIPVSRTVLQENIKPGEWLGNHVRFLELGSHSTGGPSLFSSPVTGRLHAGVWLLRVLEVEDWAQCGCTSFSPPPPPSLSPILQPRRKRRWLSEFVLGQN